MTSAHVSEYASLLRMADSRTLDTTLVDRGLESASSAVRELAARTIGQVGRTQAVPRVARLRLLLRSADVQVAAQAAHSLGILRDTAAVADLSIALAAPPHAAREAAWALGQAGAAARAAITDALARPPADPGTRVQLLLASAKLTPVPAASVIRFFTDEHPSVVWAAAYAISRTRTAAGLRALLSLADSSVAIGPARTFAPGAGLTAPYLDPAGAPHRIRAEIARAVPRSATGDSLATHAIAVLERLAGDPHPHVRINAIRSLGSYGTRTRASVIAGARDSDPNGRIAAVQSLATVRDSSVVPWLELWVLDTAHMYQRSLLESSLRFGAELPAVETWARDAEWRRRAAVASAAGGAPTGAQSVRLAEPLLSDSDARVRAAALSGIGSDTGRIDARVRALIASAGRDQDRMVRERAAALLSRRPEDESERAAPVRDLAWYEDVVRTIVEPTLGGRPIRVVLATERGRIEIAFFGADAPLTVKNFLDLARAGTYRGTRFHRVVPNFVLQDGDPRGDGSGGPGYSIRDELNRHRYDRGVLGMALSGPDTGGSQWFITHSPQPHLDGGYTVFGRVVSGFDALDRIVQGDLVIGVR